MADEVSQRIIDAITLELKKIKIADGYRSDVGLHVFADRADTEPLDETELPAIIVRDPEEEDDPETIGYENLLMRIEVICFAAGTDAVKFIRNTLFPDVRKVIKVNRLLYWGMREIVLDTIIVGRTIDFTREERKLANGAIRINVNYREPRAAV